MYKKTAANLYLRQSFYQIFAKKIHFVPMLSGPFILMLYNLS